VISIDGTGATIPENTNANQRLFFVHSALDDDGLSPQAYRLLFHLRRRIGNSDPSKGPGIVSMADVCRMEKKSIIATLKWLEERRFIEICRPPGRRHRYKILGDKSLFFVHRSIDDLGLSASTFRVLGHMSRLSGENGEFYINKSKFSHICRLHRETIDSALSHLATYDFFDTDEDRKNPRRFLTLEDGIQKAARKRRSNQPASTPVIGRNAVTPALESRNPTLEIRNTVCWKAVTKGDPCKGSPKEGIQIGNPAPDDPVAPTPGRIINDQLLELVTRDWLANKTTIPASARLSELTAPTLGYSI
jgi:hypothetical protein